MKRNKFFLAKVYHLSKPLFMFFLSFSFLNLLFNTFYKTEQTPIFQWSLYAYPLPENETYTLLEVKYNNDVLLSFPHTWQEPAKLLLTNTINSFVHHEIYKGSDYVKNTYQQSWMQSNGMFHRLFPKFKPYNDSLDFRKFPAWYKRKLEKVTGVSIYRIAIYETNVRFLNNGVPRKIGSKLIHQLL